jgi:hypothetical protein
LNDLYTRVTAPAGLDGQATKRDYYFKTRNAAREFRLRIKRWKAEQKSPADTLSFDDSDKRWLAYLRAHVGNLELLPAIVTRMLHTGWRAQGKRDWANSPNEWAILRPSANGITWKR